MSRIPSALILIAVCAVLGFLAILPLGWQDQTILGVLLVASAMLVNRFFPGQKSTIVLVLAACFCTSRYAYYRFSETFLNIQSAWSSLQVLDLIFVLALLFAEGYAFLILWMGSMQTIRPLKRRPLPLPKDPQNWPFVDLYIPTYDESLEIVKITVLAALNLDWPADKYAVYILDDGRRPEFKKFAEACNVGYIVRLDNAHAKAGNINNALRQTKGQYIAIFDCDHIPTRTFLQMTMGWLMADPHLAMVQTPHHYYSPDPFERNLQVFQTVPNEGALFYGVIQDGNDLWNATFFCGSCAVMRRTALDEVGGIAVETVTEDAHTAVRFHSAGWETAYINIPLAAGLATLRLADHVGQRIRWARGMVQILRIDCPLFKSGLTIPQRLCYLNGMFHFLFAVPRLIFLTAPLVYLVFGRSNVLGYLPAILAYGFPHLIIATASNSRIQGKYRHSFWNEIYEIALTPYILFPTCLALINPKWGKFNVTGKEAIVAGSYFDFKIARPFLALLCMNLTGIGFAIWKYFQTGDPNGVLRINCFWSFFNCILLSATMSVAYERRQRRGVTRVAAQLPVEVALRDGRIIEGRSRDLSMGGMNISLAQNIPLDTGELGSVSISVSGEIQTFPIAVVKSRGPELRVRFHDMDLALQASLVRTIFCRADTWLYWSRNYSPDRPLRSLFAVIGLSFRGIGNCINAMIPRRAPSVPPVRVAARTGATLLLVTLVASWGALAPGARAQSVDAPAEAIKNSAGVGPSFHDTWHLGAIGNNNGIDLKGDRTPSALSFGITPTKLVTAAKIEVSFQIEKGIAPNSHIDVSLNGSPAGSIPVNSDAASDTQTELTLPAELFTTDNTLTFQFVGTCVRNAGCELLAHEPWATIAAASTISVSGVLVPALNDLSLLPDAFFSNYSRGQIALPFVFDSQSNANPVILEAAAAVASWLGTKAGNRGIRLPARFGQIPFGNALIVATRGSAVLQTFALPESSGPLIAIRDNPVDPFGKVLVVTGQNDRDVLNAARALAMMKSSGSGDTAEVASTEMSPPRVPYDAPQWLPTERDVNLTDGMADADLQVHGTGAVNFYFRLPPDIYYGGRQTVPFHLRYRCGLNAQGGKAEIRIFLNGALVTQRMVSPGSEIESREAVILLPAVSLYARNTLSVEFAFGEPSTDVSRLSSSNGRSRTTGAVLRGSGIAVQGMSHFVEMPRLDLFANSGFPFTRLADLSKTAVIVPPSHQADAVSVFLTAMGFMGAQTGYPALRVTVSDSGNIPESSDKDLLVIGSFENQPALKALRSSLAVEERDGLLRLNSPATAFDPAGWWLAWRSDTKSERTLESILESSRPDGIIQSFQSPSDPLRTVVVITPAVGGNLGAFLDYWPNSRAATQIRGNVAILSGGEFNSFASNRSLYRIGQLSIWQGMQFWAARYFFAIPLLVFGSIFLMAGILHRRMELRAERRLEIEKTWREVCSQ